MFDDEAGGPPPMTYWTLGLVVVLALAGCATAPRPQLSREQWMALKTKDYQDVTPARAYQAAEQLLRLADPEDVTVTYDAEGRLQAVRTWRMWTGFFLFTQYGADTWRVRAEPVGTGARVMVSVSRAGETGAQPLTGLDDDPALYDLWWARMEYLLGRATTWLTCAAFQERTGRAYGDPFLLCDPFTIEDRAPEAFTAR
ncbi:MAG: hypothetical protein ACREK6_15385 [Candidatus Rokuibacteriota bacterium]